MPKACAIIAIIKEEEHSVLGNALTPIFITMLRVTAALVIQHTCDSAKKSN
tara:strand:- start:6 stop:158 length:153 start_codon:yes stop_codon:yes gene_type:complete